MKDAENLPLSRLQYSSLFWRNLFWVMMGKWGHKRRGVRGRGGGGRWILKAFKPCTYLGITVSSSTSFKWHHFMASFYCLWEYSPQKTAVDLFFTINGKKYQRNWLYFLLRKRALYIWRHFYRVCRLLDNRYNQSARGNFSFFRS